MFESATATEDNNELTSSGDTKDISQSLTGAQDLPVETKEPDDKESAEASEAAKSEEPIEGKVEKAGQSEGAQDPEGLPQGTDEQEMQVENKDVISEEQDPSTDDNNEEVFAAASASKEDSAT